MKCLVVIAHPAHDGLCRTLAQHAVSTLNAHATDTHIARLQAAEALAPEQGQAFRARIGRTLSKWARA